MTKARIRSGRALALLAITVVSFNMRTAIAAVSPLADAIVVDIPMSSVHLGIIGMLPPVSFAAFGLCTPLIARRVGLESTMLVAIVMMTAGHGLRGMSASFWDFFAASIVTLAGMGMGNVLLPPLIKRYFPLRIGLLTTITGIMMSMGTAAPALLATPIEQVLGWRVSIGSWALLSLVALLPWIALLRERRTTRRTSDAAPELREPGAEALGKVWHSSIAWAIAIAFTVAPFNAYSMLAWLPLVLTETAGLSAAQAGALLSLYGAVGIPAALVAPALAVRMKNVGLLVHAGLAAMVVGYVGLIVAPAAFPVLWVGLAGLGGLLFPVCLVLINLRTRTERGAVALSGFSQGVGYTLGATGSLLFGVLRDATESWTAPLVMLLATAVIGAGAGLVLAKRRLLEDDWHPRGRPRDE